MKINEVLGPHQGQEYELLSKGKKDVALTVDYEDSYNKLFGAAKRGFLAHFKTPSFNPTMYIHIFTRKTPEAINKGKDLLNIYKSDEYLYGHFTPETHKRIGRILGYTEEDIEHFLREIE